MSIDLKILEELHLTTFVALDIETTGLDYQCEDIIEFGGVKFVNGKPDETLQILIKPSRPIPEYITNITGITNEDVVDAPQLSEVADRILEFVSDVPLVAHNIIFDLPFLEYHLRRVKNINFTGEKIKDYLIFPNAKYDTLILSKMYIPFLPSFSLSKLEEYFDVKTEISHRALPDALGAGEVFLKLVEIALQTDFRDVRKICEILEPTSDPIKEFFLNLQNLLTSGKYHIPKTIDRESFWYSANYYNIIGEEDTPTTGRLEIVPIDKDEIGRFFDAGGILEESFGAYEFRPAQQEMAMAVARAFNEQQFLVVEAGTGTGKSMAYLLPAIKWSVQNYGPFGRIIISTNTKNLQEQLFLKDIPILHSILKEKFKAVLLKGKANYLCLDKWFTVLHDMNYRLSVDERVKILPLYLWVKHTETGDISENNGFAAERNMGLWSKFIAENNYCPGKSCKYYNQCFLMRARNNARDAHLVLVNHSLLFSDLASNQAILAEYANVILDEAHNIEKVATEYLGSGISIWEFRDAFRKLHQKNRIETGVLIQMRKRIQLSDMPPEKKELLFGHIDRLIPLVDNGWAVIQGFFRELSNQLRQMVPESTEGQYSTRIRYQRNSGLFERMESYYTEANRNLETILDGVNDLIELLKEIPENSFNFQKQIYQELQAQFAQLDGLKMTLEFLIKAEWDNWVYWFEPIFFTKNFTLI